MSADFFWLVLHVVCLTQVLLVQEKVCPSRTKPETQNGWLAVQLLMFAVGLKSLHAAIGVKGDLPAHQPELCTST